MMEILRKAWASLRRTSDWRSFIGEEPPWLRFDAVIIGGSSGPGGTRAPRQSYEVYLRGKLTAQRHSLTDAKAVIEREFGLVPWQRTTTEPVEVEHYHFGPTTEFSSPNTYWYVETL